MTRPKDQPRKTMEEYHIYVDYGQGWEHETTELSYKECKAQVKIYQTEQPYPVRWESKRVPNPAYKEYLNAENRKRA